MSFIEKMLTAGIFIAVSTIQIDSFASEQQVAPINLEVSVYTDTVVALERENLEQATIDTERIKAEATLIINAAHERLAEGEISHLQAAKIIGEQNYIIEQAKAQLAEMTNISIENVKDAEAQESYLSQLISGARTASTDLLEKVGYRSTARDKAIAQAIIDELNNQLKDLEKKYREKMNVVTMSDQDKIRISQEFKATKQEIENEIYRQQGIAEKVMSTNKKLFWSAVGLAGVAAGSVLAYKYLSSEMLGKAGELMQAEKEEERRLDKAVLEMEQAYNEKEALKQAGELMQTTKDEERRFDKGILEMEQAYNEQEALKEAGELMQAEKNKERRFDKRVLEDEQSYNTDQEMIAKIYPELIAMEAETKAVFEKFVQEHTPPADVQKIIDNNKEVIAYGGTPRLKGEDGSIVVISKGDDVHRVFNADVLRQYIEDNSFDSLAVPKKWIYETNGRWMVFAEYINGEPISRQNLLNLKETQDLVSFVEKTGYHDYGFGYGDNIIRDSRNGKLVFIDVEDSSFSGNISKQTLINHLFYAMSPYMNTDALQWSKDYYSYLQNNPEGKTITGYFPISGEWKQNFKNYLQEHPTKEIPYKPESDLEKISELFNIRNELRFWKAKAHSL